ncbi:MAG: PEP-utilizing enzyme, partial [bacterium]
DNNLNPEDLKSYTFDEIFRLIEVKIPVIQDVILERRKSYVVYCENEAMISIDGVAKKTILNRFKEDDHSEKTEFNGVIANKGRVIAKARVILPELDQAYEKFVKKLLTIKMNQGEILVTETTSPDFVILMKKAGGIIANQGGLNSHAAIMSRELGVPCLVGAHIATDVLKTGDLIELDANKGVVRLIKRA